MSSKLTKEQRQKRDNERFSQRVAERRERGEDVVQYALSNSKAAKFLTASEKEQLKKRRKQQQDKEKANIDLAIEIADIMLQAVKNDIDPDGPETRKAIRNAKARFRQGGAQ